MTYRRPNTTYESTENRDDNNRIFKLYYDEHTLYIENNGHTDNQVLDLLDVVIKTHPRFDVLFPETKPYRRGETYTSVHVHSIADPSKNIEFRDRTYVFIYDVRIYRHIIMRDIDSGRNPKRFPLSPQLIKIKEEEETERNKAAMSSWADETESDELIQHKYEVLTYPYLIPGVTTFDDSTKEKNWRRFLTDPRDIAIMRGIVKDVKPQFVPNQLRVSNIPSAVIGDKAAEAMAKRYATTATPIDVKYFLEKTKAGEIPRASMTITYDKNTMDASFAFTFFRFMRIPVSRGGVTEYVPLKCEYLRLGGKRR